MGTLIAEALTAEGGFLVAGTYDINNINELDEVAADSDLVIDFSNKAALPHVLAYVQRTGAALVSGTTGFDEAEQAQICALGALAPVVWSGNYSLGVAALRHATELVAAAVDWDVEIVETHHIRKADAPSGTALSLAEAVREVRPGSVIKTGRSGFGVREHTDIGVQSIRMGNVPGIHEVIIGTGSQTLTLRHEVHDRSLFAEGALAAAEFLAGKPAGLYDMNCLISG